MGWKHPTRGGSWWSADVGQPGVLAPLALTRTHRLYGSRLGSGYRCAQLLKFYQRTHAPFLLCSSILHRGECRRNNYRYFNSEIQRSNKFGTVEFLIIIFLPMFEYIHICKKKNSIFRYSFWNTWNNMKVFLYLRVFLLKRFCRELSKSILAACNREAELQKSRASTK